MATQVANPSSALGSGSIPGRYLGYQQERPPEERGLPEWELRRRDLERAGFDVFGKPLVK